MAVPGQVPDTLQLPAGTCEEVLEGFGNLVLALSIENFNQEWQIVAPWDMTFEISVKADPSSSNFIFSLPDNLFKPKERVIPEKEMHMRSKRYKSLCLEFVHEFFSALSP